MLRRAPQPDPHVVAVCSKSQKAPKVAVQCGVGESDGQSNENPTRGGCLSSSYSRRGLVVSFTSVGTTPSVTLPFG
jgi:hypothetical protein